jgi:hypothetical protein
MASVLTLLGKNKTLRIHHLKMRRTRFLEQEKRQEAEKVIKYRGTASIELDVLHFPRTKSREPDEKNVERLESLFREEDGCRRLELRHHIPAVLSQAHLDAALEASEISAERLLDHARDGYPKLDFPPGYQLDCLHGRHRVLAAKKVLPSWDRRWTVDLYLDGMASLFLHIKKILTFIFIRP